VTLRAAFFDVGDTLVEHWAAGDVLHAKSRAQVVAGMGEQPWLDDLIGAWIEPPWPTSLARAIASRAAEKVEAALEGARQTTTAWYRAWFERNKVELDGLDLDRLRELLTLPLVEISTPVAGAFEAVRWCKERDMKTALVTNTLARGDREALTDWRRFGLDDAIDAIVTSHDTGWRKPHAAIFEKALQAVGVDRADAFHVGDNLIADVWGAQQLGLRAVWRRSGRARALAGDDKPPHDPWVTLERRDPATCDHPSEVLFLDDRGDVTCGACGSAAGIQIRPDAVVDDLTELPPILERWLA
jgi:FMN phosphatase YigB (HAD superfamily)